MREQKKNLIAKSKVQKDKISQLERLISSLTSEKQGCEEMYSTVLHHWTTVLFSCIFPHYTSNFLQLLTQFEANLRTFNTVNQADLDTLSEKFAMYMKNLYSMNLENTKAASAELKELADRTNNLIQLYSSNLLVDRTKIDKILQNSTEEGLRNRIFKNQIY